VRGPFSQRSGCPRVNQGLVAFLRARFLPCRCEFRSGARPCHFDYERLRALVLIWRPTFLVATQYVHQLHPPSRRPRSHCASALLPPPDLPLSGTSLPNHRRCLWYRYRHPHSSDPSDHRHRPRWHRRPHPCDPRTNDLEPRHIASSTAAARAYAPSSSRQRIPNTTMPQWLRVQSVRCHGP